MKDELIRAAVLYKIHDGDTYHAYINLGCGIFIDTEIRLAHIDTPELNTPEGLISKNKLMEHFGCHTEFDKVNVTIQIIKKEKYGRLLCDVYFKEESVTGWLLKEGLGKSYEGGKKE